LINTDYRHQARSLALQALYELDCTDHKVGPCSVNDWQHPIRVKNNALARAGAGRALENQYRSTR
jgi:transcription termination factor NusB